MMCLLQLLVFLFCVQRGEGHQLRSLIGGQNLEASWSKTTSHVVKRSYDQVPGAGSTGQQVHHSTTYTPCQLHHKVVRVRELGLGYESEEEVKFKYCKGSCRHARTNHDLSLNYMVDNGVLDPPETEEVWQRAPCCRPTRYDKVVFLDNSGQWHKLEEIFAEECACTS